MYISATRGKVADAGKVGLNSVAGFFGGLGDGESHRYHHPHNSAPYYSNGPQASKKIEVPMEQRRKHIVGRDETRGKVIPK
jgi:hypothetical protein